VINLSVRFINFDFNFVEDTFGAYEEVSCGRIRAPDNSGSTVHFNAESASSGEPVQHGQIARQDRIFRMFEVFVLHTTRTL